MAPTFPSSFALAGEKPAAAPRGKVGLYEGLIGDARVLYQALQEDPERFEDGLEDLLHEILSSNKSTEDLDPEKKRALDRAVLDFAMGKTALGEPRKKPAPSGLSRAREATGPSMPELEHHEGGRLIPVERDAPIEIPDVPTFWWTKT